MVALASSSDGKRNGKAAARPPDPRGAATFTAPGPSVVLGQDPKYRNDFGGTGRASPRALVGYPDLTRSCNQASGTTRDGANLCEPAAGWLAVAPYAAWGTAVFSTGLCRLTRVQQVSVQLYVYGSERPVLLQVCWQQSLVAICSRVLGGALQYSGQHRDGHVMCYLWATEKFGVTGIPYSTLKRCYGNCSGHAGAAPPWPQPPIAN